MEINAWIGKVKFFQHKGLVYGHRVVNTLMQTLILLLTVIVLNTALLYVVNMLWTTYRETPLGKAFVVSHARQARLMSEILGGDYLTLSIELALTAFVICLAVAAVSRLMHIMRLFYEPLPTVWRAIFWGAPLIVAVTYRIQSIHHFSIWETALSVSFLPVLLVFSGAFLFASELLPELGDIFDWIRGAD